MQVQVLDHRLRQALLPIQSHRLPQQHAQMPPLDQTASVREDTSAVPIHAD